MRSNHTSHGHVERVHRARPRPPYRRGTALQRYLAPLESFVNSLGNFSAITPPHEFLEHHAAEAAAATKATVSAVAGTGLTPGRRLALG